MTPNAPRPPSAVVVGSFVHACCWHVARLPLPGESVAAAALHTEAGGKGLNVAVGLARLGCQVATLMACGSDGPAAQLLALLDAEGIDRRHVQQLPGASGMGCGLVGPGGENLVVVYPGANALLTAAHADAAADDLRAAQLVYAQLEAALPAVERALAIAAAAGVLTVLNPSPWQAPSAALRAATQVVVVNQTEAAALLRLSAAADVAVDVGAVLCSPAAAGVLARFAQDWPRATQLVVTLGAQGSVGFERQGKAGWRGWLVAACAVQAVDNVGAGDAFAAAYAAVLVQGDGMPSAMQSAHFCAARVVAGAGVLARLPQAAALAAWRATGAVLQVRLLNGLMAK